MMNRELNSRVKQIKLVISDVDGVLTDGSIFMSDNGNEMKQFSVEDAAGCAIAKHADLPVAFISGRKSQATVIRLKEMNIRHFHLGCLNKTEPFEQLLDTFQVDAFEVAYIGDGLVDLPVMERCGVKAAPPGSHPLVLKIADYITEKPGGKGALRELIEWILFTQDLFFPAYEKMRKQVYLKNRVNH